MTDEELSEAEKRLIIDPESASGTRLLTKYMHNYQAAHQGQFTKRKYQWLASPGFSKSLTQPKVVHLKIELTTLKCKLKN